MAFVSVRYFPIALCLILGSFLPQGRMAAQSLPQVVALWAEGEVPHALGNEAKDQPTAWLFRLPLADQAAADSRHPCLVILPGGGYGGLAVDHEGEQIARWANSLGMVALVCKYRHRKDGYGHPVPMTDAQRAVRMTRANAQAWGVDPSRVGVIGFSAGGHLASTLLTHHDPGNAAAKDLIARQSSRPDFGILCYPVIGMGKSYTHAGSQRNLLGEVPDPGLIALLSNEDQVTADTPPTFLFHTHEDRGVVPANSLAFYAALIKHNVPAELHVFQKGKHGLGLATGTPGTEQWPDLCRLWLQQLGVLRS